MGTFRLSLIIITTILLMLNIIIGNNIKEKAVVNFLLLSYLLYLLAT